MIVLAVLVVRAMGPQARAVSPNTAPVGSGDLRLYESSQDKNGASLLPPMSAWPVRHQALAVTALSSGGLSQTALIAWAARYQGQAEANNAGQSQNTAAAWFARTDAYNSQRALDAWAARYQGQAEANNAGLSQNTAAAWFARTNAYNSQRALDAWAAHYQGQADALLGSGGLSQAAMTAWGARYQGQAEALANLAVVDFHYSGR